ncbi:MAG: 3-hydroxyacyl-CoA dehydrogenase NAD-binding domain-containing protein, partial [Brevundimonas sp.]
MTVIGAGQMGLGISPVVALGGYEVGLYDADPARPPQAIVAVAASLARNVARGGLATAEADAALARIRPVETLAEVAGADLVIEAATEDEAVKKAVFA